MTAAPNLPVRRPLILDGEAVVTAKQRHGTNPHALPLGASATLTFVAGVGTFWSIYHGSDHAALAFVVLLVMLATTVGFLCRFNAAAAEANR